MCKIRNGRFLARHPSLLPTVRIFLCWGVDKSIFILAMPNATTAVTTKPWKGTKHTNILEKIEVRQQALHEWVNNNKKFDLKNTHQGMLIFGRK